MEIKSKPFKGILKKPITANLLRVPRHGDNSELISALSGLPDWDLKIDREDYREQRQERVAALFAHFDIDPKLKNAATQLVNALADQCVPGFRVKMYYEQRGRRRLWNKYLDQALWWEVSIRRKERKSVQQACDAILRNKKTNELFEGRQASTLKARYYEIDKIDNPDIDMVRRVLELPDDERKAFGNFDFSKAIKKHAESVKRKGFDDSDLPMSEKSSG